MSQHKLNDNLGQRRTGSENLITPAGTAEIDWALSRSLSNHRVLLSLDRKPYEMPVERQAEAAVFLSERLPKGAFNGELLGLGGTLSAPAKEVTLIAGGYFDHLATDIAFGRSDSAEDQNWRFQAVGVSTLAFTTEGLLAVPRQAKANQSSRDLLAPSGSGSLEPSDLAGELELLPVLRRGALRELREELGLTAADVSDVQFLGFARWLEKGGKPEFFFNAQLSLSAEAVHQRQMRAAEQKYVAGLNFLTLAEAAASEQASLPLAVGLRLLDGAP